VLYSFLRFVLPLFLKIYNKKIVFNAPNVLNTNGPLLIACNHPNSFLDAIILCAYFKRPIHALARGDAFAKPLSNYLLRLLRILPVYRKTEGGVKNNYATFDACLQVFKKNGVVLIFSEALCVNEWQLRPLKKGTARLAALAWQQQIPLQIVCCGINYSNFYKPAKIVHVNFSNVTSVQKINTTNANGPHLTNSLHQFICASLQPLVYIIPTKKNNNLTSYFLHPNTSKSFLHKILRVFNWPFIVLIKLLTKKIRVEVEHHDATMFALCSCLILPYLLMLFFVFAYFNLSVLILLPIIFAIGYLKTKPVY
jgi:1-acyl-sn-glycerol-3-phosphate acyltransferase